MAKKKKEDTITLSLDSFENFIWMSYRYCIGRSTIASHYHARDVATALSLLEESKQRHNANDIMREVNDKVNFIGWSCNVYLNNEISMINICLQYVEDNNLCEHFDDLRFDVNMNYNTHELSVSHSISKNKNQYLHTITDLLIWNDVANLYLKDNHKIAVVEYNEETTEKEVYESWTECWGESFKYKKCYRSVEDGKKGNFDLYLNEDYIKEIKDI